MDRNKLNPRNVKGKITHHPADLFALGSKPSTSGQDDKRLNLSVLPKIGTLPTDRKREASSTSLAVPAKKSKLIPGFPTSSIYHTTSSVVEDWENHVIECDDIPACLIHASKAIADEDDPKCVGYTLMIIRYLRNQKTKKPEDYLLNGLTFIVKMRATIVQNCHVTNALCSLVRRETATTSASSLALKNKTIGCVPLLAISLLMSGYEHVEHWPEIFLKIYLEDALGERVWVDSDVCATFVENIQLAFNTRTPPKSLLQSDLTILGVRDNSPLTVMDDDDASKRKIKTDMEVYARFPHLLEAVETMVVDYTKEHMNRKQTSDAFTRSFLKFLTTASGLVEIRMLAVTRLEMWLHNAKLMRAAQELLVYVCYNSVAVTQRDVEVISQLIKIRFKTKGFVNVFLNCLREMVATYPKNLPVILKHTIYNELSNARNPNNMAMISVMFVTMPTQAPTVLADIFFELLLNKEDFLRPIRALLREIMRVLRYDLDLYALVKALIERKDTATVLRDFEFKDRVFTSLVDLICLSMFLTVSPQVRDAAGLYARGDKRDAHVLIKYQSTITRIQSDTIFWLRDTVLRAFNPSAVDFNLNMKKLLLLEPIDNYCKQDTWPMENERQTIMRLACETPLVAPTIVGILHIGLSKEHPVQQVDALEYLEALIKRVAATSVDGIDMLTIDEPDIIELILNASIYRYPESTALPIGYIPPNLAISNSYWRSWIMILMLAARNPLSLGSVCWETYPTLRMLIEMCVTNHFTYPPPTITMTENCDELKTKELQMATIEKQQVLDFESHLAGNLITEQNSHLLQKLITFDPRGLPRRPPTHVLDQLRSLNISHRLGHLLCRSRRPDFLLDIIQRHGVNQHMPWLTELVQNSALHDLPVQCLCEFLLSSGVGAHDKLDKPTRQKHAEVVAHLNRLVVSGDHDPAVAYEVLEYFLRRLYAQHYGSRTHAIRGVKMILKPDGSDDAMDDEASDAWLNKHLPAIAHFAYVRVQVVDALRQAIQAENNPKHVSSYIIFLAAHIPDNFPDVVGLVTDIAQLIVERSTILSAILPRDSETSVSIALDDSLESRTFAALLRVFLVYVQQARDMFKSDYEYEWVDMQEPLLIQWHDGESCVIYTLVVHAIIILLTLGPLENSPAYNELLEQWFPTAHAHPVAYIFDQNDAQSPTLFVPDWLKLRMIRSSVACLVDFALVKLEAAQLVLFIQSFGIPVASMSKILMMVDHAVMLDASAVAEAVLDKTFMAQLMAVQRRRGAVGGERFVQALGLDEPIVDDPARVTRGNFKRKYDNGNLRLTRDKSVIDESKIVDLLNLITFNVAAVDRVEYDHFIKTLITHNEVNAVPLDILVHYMYINRISPIFIQQLAANNCYINHLFHIILTANVPAHRPMIAEILTYLNESFPRDHLTYLLREYTRTHSSVTHGDVKHELIFIKPECQTVDGFVNALKTTPTMTFEKFGQKMIETSLRARNTVMIVEAIARVIDDISRGQLALNCVGILVDWLALIEPELIGASPDAQMELMFSKDMQVNAYRAYLLTLLIHRGSWATLHKCIGHLLNESAVRYDATTVLEFFTAITQNPKLWQGRDKSASKYEQRRVIDVLELSHFELKSLVNYILDEAIHLDASKSRADAFAAIEKRLPLLLQCLDQPDSITFTVRYLLTITRHDTTPIKTEDDRATQSPRVIDVDACDDSRRRIARKFILLLYMYIPRVWNVAQRIIAHERTLKHLSFSACDKVSHCLLTALAAPCYTKETAYRAEEYEILARKMTQTHALLMLRQLPVMAGMLHARAHFDLKVLRARGHLNLYVQVLGLVELLQPTVFEADYRDEFHDLIGQYFNLLRFHGPSKEMSPILNRFVTLVREYIRHSAKQAMRFVQKHAQLLSDLQQYHPGLVTLNDLMLGVSLPRTTNTHDDVLVSCNFKANVDQLPKNWEQILASLHRAQGDEVTAALHDIDHLSNRRATLLTRVLVPVCNLLSSPCETIRRLSYGMLLKYLKQNPAKTRASSTVLAHLMRCLNSSNCAIVVSLMERLPELCVLMQDDAQVILEKVFALGIGSDVDTAPYITQTVELLHLQRGC